MSNIVTFYSYKGGVGRSMSLANTAVLLSRWGYTVLIVDWDLEAPGLEHFFQQFIDKEIVKKKIGIIDLLNNDNKPWQDAIIPITVPDSREAIHMISSGQRTEDYFKKVREFSIDKFYQNGGGEIIETLRDDWKRTYDFILIDSRTGITEIGGICTVQLPDQVVMLFTATDQGFEGTLDVANRVLKAQQGLPYDRQKLIFIPILTKFDAQTEFKLSEKWIDLFADRLKDIYKDWLPLSIKRDEFIRVTKIPYLTYFSFGESLPVLEQSFSDTSGLSYAYENLASLLANKINDVGSLIFARDKFISDSQKALRQEIKGNIPIREINKGLRIFISYSHQDSVYKTELESYLSVLRLKYNISIWSDDLLLPGDRWEDIIMNELLESDIVLLLVSQHYMVSESAIFQIDLAMKLTKPVIPIILRPLSLEYSPISRLLSLPRRGQALSLLEDREKGYLEIVQELERLILNMTDKDLSKDILRTPSKRLRDSDQDESMQTYS